MSVFFHLKGCFPLDLLQSEHVTVLDALEGADAIEFSSKVDPAISSPPPSTNGCSSNEDWVEPKAAASI